MYLNFLFSTIHALKKNSSFLNFNSKNPYIKNDTQLYGRHNQSI